MRNIRILGLDDDYHSPFYISENGDCFPNIKTLIDFLSKPHKESYEVKVFSIIGDLSAEIYELGEEKVFKMFDELLNNNFNLTSFNLFWNSTNCFW